MQVPIWTAPSCVGDFDHRVEQVWTVGSDDIYVVANVQIQLMYTLAS